jgi:hypothetical protein
MAHLERQAAVTGAERLRVKVNLFRRLLGRGRDRKDIIHLFRFIDWRLVLPPELEAESRRQITELLEGTVMPHIGGVERFAMPWSSGSSSAGS